MFRIVSVKFSQRKSSTVVGNTNVDLALLNAFTHAQKYTYRDTNHNRNGKTLLFGVTSE